MKETVVRVSYVRPCLTKLLHCLGLPELARRLSLLQQFADMCPPVILESDDDLWFVPQPTKPCLFLPLDS